MDRNVEEGGGKWLVIVSPGNVDGRIVRSLSKGLFDKLESKRGEEDQRVSF